MLLWILGHALMHRAFHQRVPIGVPLAGMLVALLINLRQIVDVALRPTLTIDPQGSPGSGAGCGRGSCRGD